MLLDVVGVSILYPVAAFIVQRYSDRALAVTLLSVAYSAAQFVCAPALGKLSDRVGRRPVLLVSLLGSALGYVLFGIGGALWILVLSRVLDGVTAGNMSTATAVIADVSSDQTRGRNFGLVGLAWGIGLVVGPALGGLLGQLDLALPAYVAAALSLANFGLVARVLPETVSAGGRQGPRFRPADLNPFGAIGQMLGRPGVGRILVALSVFNVAFFARTSVDSVFLIRRFGAEPWVVGLVLVLSGAAIALGQVFLVPRLVVRPREAPVAVASLICLAVGSIGLAVAPSVWLFCVVLVLFAVVSNLVFPSLGAIGTRRIGGQEIGQLIGVNTALSSLMSVIGPLWAGAAFDAIHPRAPYLLGAAIYMVPVLILALSELRRKEG
jgi:DHA1 family tetracycline resistance protein-like MFS transporter